MNDTTGDLEHAMFSRAEMGAAPCTGARADERAWHRRVAHHSGRELPVFRGRFRQPGAELLAHPAVHLHPAARSRPHHRHPRGAQHRDRLLRRRRAPVHRAAELPARDGAGCDRGRRARPRPNRGGARPGATSGDPGGRLPDATNLVVRRAVHRCGGHHHPTAHAEIERRACVHEKGGRDHRPRPAALVRSGAPRHDRAGRRPAHAPVDPGGRRRAHLVRHLAARRTGSRSRVQIRAPAREGRGARG